MIFIVDDDQAVRRSSSLLLDSEGLESQGFADAHQFLDRCHPSDGDCLIVDVDLPGMDGIQLVQRVRANDQTLPVLVITGHPSTFMRQRAREAGATAFLEKPLEADRVVSFVRDGRAP
jgi:two-component system response regulator FixJ